MGQELGSYLRYLDRWPSQISSWNLEGLPDVHQLNYALLNVLEGDSKLIVDSGTTNGALL